MLLKMNVCCLVILSCILLICMSFSDFVVYACVMYVFSDFVVYACCVCCVVNHLLMYVCDMNGHLCEYEVA